MAKGRDDKPTRSRRFPSRRYRILGVAGTLPHLASPHLPSPQIGRWRPAALKSLGSLHHR